MTAPSERFERLCDVCGGLDTDPRHVQSAAPGTPDTVPNGEFIREAIRTGASDGAIDELMDPSTVVRHMDCCASKGCDLCTEVGTRSKNVKGKDLVDFLVAGGADDLGDTPAAPAQNAEV